MITKGFEQWLAEEVEDAFGIERKETVPALEEWLNTDSREQEIEAEIEMMRKLLLQNADAWNEDELKVNFIAPFLLKMQFNNYPHYKVFTQRLSKVKTDTVESQGKIEWMVARGRQIPKNPFFFLQEYKPEKTSGNDPLGQLLMAILYAQQENQNTNPIYASYIIGRLWFFVVFQDNQYAVSRAYDATRIEDLKGIIIILQKVKEYIEKYLGL